MNLAVQILNFATAAWVAEVANATRHQPHESITSIAEEMYEWIFPSPRRFRAFLGLAYEQGEDSPPPYYLEITNMADSINLTDTQQVTIAIEADDSKGFKVTESIQWSVDDSTVAGLVPSSDGGTVLVVAGQPGNAVVKASDGALEEIFAVTVSTGAAATFKSTIGTPEEQPAAQPTPPADTVTTPPPADASGSTTTATDTSSGDPAATDSSVPGPGASGVTPPAQVG